MEKVLLVFLNNLKYIEKFDTIIDMFSEQHYKIYFYDDINSIDFSYTDLPEIIRYYDEKGTNKVVVLSNIRDLLYFWFRCYNQLVDDFIYFIEDEENNFFDVDDKFYSVYFNVFEFNGIENETINGSIYLTEKNSTILPLYFKPIYFDLIHNFDFNRKINRGIINKIYETEEYSFAFNNFDRQNSETIKLEKINRRIAFFKGQSSYNVQTIGTYNKAEFYKKLGFDVDIIDLLSADVNELMEKLMKKKYSFVFSANCMGIDATVSDGRNLYEAMNIPFFGALGDHPVNHYKRIMTSPEKTLFSCIDYENILYFEKHFPDKKIITNYATAFKSKNFKTRPFVDREIDVLFAGTLFDPEDIKKEWNAYDSNTRDLLNNISEKIIENGKLSNIEKEITLLMKGYKINEIGTAALYSLIEKYIRNYKRYHLVKLLGESGLNVHCIGDVEAYEKLNKSGNLKIYDRVDYDELLDIYGNCKMLINMTGHLNYGVTERIMSAMLNGAAVVTEKDPFTASNFINDENIIFYDFKERDLLIDKVRAYLEDIPKLEKVAQNGKYIAKKYDFRTFLTKLPRIIRGFDEEFDKKINVTKTYLPDINKFKRYVNLIFDNGQITNNGQLVRKLENRLAQYFGVKNLILVTNGTLALQVAYKLLGLNGDVITTPFSFVATTSSLVWEGLNPVFVDINKDTLNIDVDKIEEKISEKTSAILPVHVYGNGCEVEKINEIAQKHNLKIIYDAAHAFGVNYNGKSILEFGDISVISFHATKVFHSTEGGALIIKDDKLYEKAKKMINFGITGPETIDGLGINAKMNEFQAAMGLCVLDDMEVIEYKRKFVYDAYLNFLPKHLSIPKHNQHCSYNYGYFPVIFRNEEELLKSMKILEKNNITPRRYFHPSLDTLKYIKSNEMPITNDISRRILCLPMSAELSENDLVKIISLLRL